jgi:hypothetical protein
MTKADAIRESVRNDPSLSNDQIKKLVVLKYGLVVESNHINNILGPYSRRKHLGLAGKNYLKLAEQCLAGFGGDRRLAVTYLNLV